MDKKSTAHDSFEGFGKLIRSTMAEGILDEKTKEIITFSLVVLSKCRECIEVHFDKALKMGITEDELNEAAWCAIAMGGAPVKMFYSKYLESRTEKKK